MAKNFEVRIADMSFDQQNVTISVGDTVTWINDDDTTHSVTKDPASPLSITEIVLDSNIYSARQVFATAGLLKYHCKFHPMMTGSVTVT